ncbi:MAG: L,D-transpeptidase family protein [Magnetovibrio sp.]|nr:L,D-transpeptidase family protein [Magnetovibrio sp.]
MRILVEPDGFVVFSHQRMRCALGKGGIRIDKCEGDGATPVGEFALGRVFYRPDRLSTPPSAELTIQPLTKNMGWCDDTRHPDYNCLITLPHPAHHEKMWREDGLYDVVVEILYNTDPPRANIGSAIFIHVAKPNYAPTEGCIALKLDDLLKLLRMCTKTSFITIPAPS